jgi:5-methylcytosine-specific restriction endonuclease McrA
MPRSNSHRRGYTDKWERARGSFLVDYPYCLGCAAIGLSREATVADHVVPHEGDASKFWAELQPLCKWHHDSIKPMLERQWKAGKIPAVALRMNSPQAVALTKARHKPAVGIDGFAIPGT